MTPTRKEPAAVCFGACLLGVDCVLLIRGGSWVSMLDQSRPVRTLDLNHVEFGVDYLGAM